jgi:hypothetical protein
LFYHDGLAATCIQSLHETLVVAAVIGAPGFAMTRHEPYCPRTSGLVKNIFRGYAKVARPPVMTGHINIEITSF